MTYATEHQRMMPVLDLVRKLDIAANPAPDALFETGSGGFQIWCTPDDHPKGWDSVRMDMGAFAKPCAFVAAVWWGWEGEKITYICIETDAYDLRAVMKRPPKIYNRPDDIVWAKRKIRLLFEQAGITCPPVRVERL